MVDVADYFDRIGYTGPAEPTADTLHALVAELGFGVERLSGRVVWMNPDGPLPAQTHQVLTDRFGIDLADLGDRVDVEARVNEVLDAYAGQQELSCPFRGRPTILIQVSEQPGARRDWLRELLDAVVDADNTDVGDMARSSYASEFHFSREVRRLTGESPAALRRRIMLERAAWRLHRGESVSTVAADEGWSSAEVFSRAFSRTFGVPPSRAADVQFRLPAPNGLHFHPPHSLWLDSDGDSKEPDISQLMVAHDIADTAYLIHQANQLSKQQWTDDISPGQVILEWDGPESSVGAVLGAIVWTKEVWLATIDGRDFPGRESTQPESTTPAQLAAHHDDLGKRWSAMVCEYAAEGRLGDTVIDALCDPPESFQLYGIVAHVLTYSAHRRELARAMLARHGVSTRRGDPLDWMRGN